MKNSTYQFYYQNTRDSSLSDKTEYFAIRFTEKEIKKSATINGKVTFKFFSSKSNSDSKIVNLKEKTDYLFDNYTYLKEQSFIINDFAEKNTPNDITIIAKKCSTDSRLQIEPANPFNPIAKATSVPEIKYMKTNFVSFVDIFLKWSSSYETK